MPIITSKRIARELKEPGNHKIQPSIPGRGKDSPLSSDQTINEIIETIMTDGLYADIQIEIEKWADAIFERISEECPYDETNDVIARIVKNAIIKDPKLLKELIGTTLIEEEYFDESK